MTVCRAYVRTYVDLQRGITDWLWIRGALRKRPELLNEASAVSGKRLPQTVKCTLQGRVDFGLLCKL